MTCKGPGVDMNRENKDINLFEGFEDFLNQ